MNAPHNPLTFALAALAADPNLDPAFRAALDRRGSRRFDADPCAPTGFGHFPGDVTVRGSDRWHEVRERHRIDDAMDLADERRERGE